MVSIELSDALTQQPTPFDHHNNCGHIAGSMRLAGDRLRGKAIIALGSQKEREQWRFNSANSAAFFDELFFAAQEDARTRKGSGGSLRPVAEGRFRNPSLSSSLTRASETERAGRSDTRMEVALTPLGHRVPTDSGLKTVLDALPRRDASALEAPQIVRSIDTLLGAVSSEAAVTELIRTNSWFGAVPADRRSFPL